MGVMTTRQLVCALCKEPIQPDQDHVRQARLQLDGLAQKGRFDVFHLEPCWKRLAAPAEDRDPDE